MSALLHSNTNFLRLLLETHKKQAILLLENTTPTQTEAIAEICYNLLDIPLPEDSQKRLVQRNTKILKKISHKKSSIKKKQKLISENPTRLYNLLKSVEDKLLTLI